MSFSFPLAEATLRQLAGKSAFNRAGNYLAANKISQRTIYRNNVLRGYWNERSLYMTVYSLDGGLECECPCDSPAYLCDHAVTLALAWLRAPDTFQQAAKDYDLEAVTDEFDDEDDEFDEFEDDALDPLAALQNLFNQTGPLVPPAPGPARAAGPVVERVTTGLAIQLPNLTEAYRQLLANANILQLRAIAARRGVALSGTKREALLSTLATALGDPHAALAAYHTLSPAARLTLSVLPFVNTDFGVQINQLRQTLQPLNPKVAQTLETALEELQTAGFIAHSHYHQTFAYPPDLAYLLPPDADFIPPEAAAIPNLRAVSAPTPFAFPQLVTRLLLTLKIEAPRLYARAKFTPSPLAQQIPQFADWPYLPAELQAINTAQRNWQQTLYSQTFTVPPGPPLLADDSQAALTRALNLPPDQLDFTLRLLAKLGLLALTPNQPLTVIEEGLQQFLNQPPLLQLSPLFNAWQSLRDWSEFDLTRTRHTHLHIRRTPYGAYTYSNWLTSLSLMRIYFNRYVRRAPAHQWINLETFVARARNLNHLQAMWPTHGGVTPYIKDRLLNPTTGQDWAAFYGPFAQTLLTGPLHWLGLVDLGYQKDNLVAFRLTDLGAFMLYQTETFNAPTVTLTGRGLTYTSDTTLALHTATADAETLNLLSLIGDIEDAREHQLIYHVTAPSMTRALEAGWDTPRILAALEKATGTRPPAALSQQLQQWQAHFGEVHLYSDLALLELADDYALNELLAGTSLAQYLLYRFSSRLIALRPEGVEKLRAELVARGYTPKVEA